MFETVPIDQSTGLRHLMPGCMLRLGGLVAQGDTDTELPLLLRLCEILQDMGHTVAVLDATFAESSASPGLRGLLDGSLDPLDVRAACDFPAGLTVLAAARGMASLCANGGATLPRLSRVFRAWDMVLVYGGAELFASLSPHCRVRPALTCAPHPQGVLAAYRSLKTLVDAEIVPAVASVVTRSGMATAAGALAARENLRQCALDRLGCRIDVLRVRAMPEAGAPDQETARLALRVLEGAATLAELSAAPPLSTDAAAQARHSALSTRSH